MHPSFPQVRHSDYSWERLLEEWNGITPGTHRRSLSFDEDMAVLPSGGGTFSTSSQRRGVSPFLPDSARDSFSTLVSPGVSVADGGSTENVFSLLVGAASSGSVRPGTSSGGDGPSSESATAPPPSPSILVAPVNSCAAEMTTVQAEARRQRLLSEY